MPEELPARTAVLVVRAWIEPEGGLRARLIGNLDIERAREQSSSATTVDDVIAQVRRWLGAFLAAAPSDGQ